VKVTYKSRSIIGLRHKYIIRVFKGSSVVKAVTLDLGCTLVFESSCIGEEPSNAMGESIKVLVTYLKGLGYDVEEKEVYKAFSKWNQTKLRYFIDCLEPSSRLRISYILKYLGITPKPEIVENSLKLTVNAATKVRRLYDDVISFLKELRKYELKLAIISNASSHEDVVETLKHFNIINYFDLVLTSNIVIYRKPAKEIFSMAAELLNVEPKESIHVGDSLVDIQGALSAGYFAAIEIARHRECLTRVCVKDLREAMKFIRTYLR